MPPKQVFIVRHGERFDKMNPETAATAARPHDSPLTADGLEMAVKLGAYLRTAHSLTDLSKLVILASPLTRCVETADGIATGLQAKGSGTTAAATPRIYIESNLLEEASWQYFDLLKNPAIATAGGHLKLPEPMWYSAEHFSAAVSPRVFVPVPGSDGGNGMPYQTGVAPDIFTEDNRLTERGFERRCLLASQAVLTSDRPLFAADATVVCVTHGGAGLQWFDSMAADPTILDHTVSPAYTAFMLLGRETAPDGSHSYVPRMPAFDTPHLSGRPPETRG